MDPARISRSLGILVTLAGAAAAQTWTQLLPAPYPTTLARRTGGLAYDPIQGKLLMHGGLQSGPTLTLDDTWTFDGATWAQPTLTSPTPPPRWGHRMVLDSRRLRIVTFGGRSPTTTATANDTWEWDGANWQQVLTPQSANPRAFYSMAFDARRGKVVMYGTQSGSTLGTAGGNQTWEYDGATWTQVVTAFVPPGLETPAMTYDKGRGVTVMFGGWNGASPGVMHDLTWEHDGVDWVQRTTATRPVARYRASCDYDDARGRVVMYGGFGNATALQDTWEYDGNDWTQVQTGGPAKSTEVYFAYSPALQAFVHFGGSGPGGTNNETWLYTGPSNAIAASFGQGCPTSAGLPALTATTTPVLGTTYTLDLSNGPASTFAFVLHGFGNLRWPLGYLPAELSAFGASGCRLEVDPAITSVIAVSGTGQQLLPFPNNPAFANLQLYTQAAIFDAGAPNGTGGMTNAVHAVLGN
ncbi:MAG: hypothetical protein U1E73_08385 [Planctomycetota bacterium]